MADVMPGLQSQSRQTPLTYSLRPLLAALVVISASQATALKGETDKPKFQDKEFWNKVYRRTQSSENDWFQQWRHPMITRKGGLNLADVIMPRLASLGSTCNQTLLHIGCGTSSMPEQMLHDGFVQQVCVDSSEVAITALSKREASLESQAIHIRSIPCGRAPSMQFLALDATNTGLESNSFDIIIDKGTLDAQVGGPTGMLEVAATLDEALRLLRISGLYVQISHSDKRSPMLDKSLDGSLRLWHAKAFGTTMPVPVLAPIAYTQGTKRDVTVSSVEPEKRKKDTTYVYIYEKSGHATDEL